MWGVAGVSAAELAAGFETSGTGGGVPVSVPLDLSTQSSMVHRMMDREVRYSGVCVRVLWW